MVAEQTKLDSIEIEVKGLNSLVSHVDKEAERRLITLLSKTIPDANFFTEEETVEQQSTGLRWIIDPLDGTTNFLHGLPHFSISVALAEDDELLIGVVLECTSDACFYAWKGGGAFLNDKAISVTKTSELADSLLATGFPYYDYSRTPSFLKVLEFFMRKTRGLRRFGSAALDLAFVAAGKFDGYFEYGLNPWDVAAGIILVEEAGGKVTDFSMDQKALSGVEILASNSQLHEKLYQQIKQMVP